MSKVSLKTKYDTNIEYDKKEEAEQLQKKLTSSSIH